LQVPLGQHGMAFVRMQAQAGIYSRRGSRLFCRVSNRNSLAQRRSFKREDHFDVRAGVRTPDELALLTAPAGQGSQSN